MLELEKIRAPAQSPPCGRFMLQNMTCQHAAGTCFKSQEVAPVHTMEGGLSSEKNRMWERNQLSLERVPLGWQEALCLTGTHLEASSSLECGTNSTDRVPARTTGPPTHANSLRPSRVGTEHSLGSEDSPRVRTSGVRP